MNPDDDAVDDTRDAAAASRIHRVRRTSSLPPPMAAAAAHETPLLFLFPSFGFRAASGSWRCEVNGWAAFDNRQSLRRKIVLGLSKWLSSPSSESDDQKFDERASLFVSAPAKDLKVQAWITGIHSHHPRITSKCSNDEDGHSLSPSAAAVSSSSSSSPMTAAAPRPLPENFPTGMGITDSAGRFTVTVDVADDTVAQFTAANALSSDGMGFVVLDAVVCLEHAPNAAFQASSTVILIPEEGLSIVSDLDDTVKESDVHMGKRAAIKTALFGDGVAVAGMSDSYRFLTGKGVPIHYVSASPHQLFPTINSFLEDNAFPIGSLMLRDIWAPTFLSTRAYKTAVISALIQRFPKRRFIFVGDSGEKDCETSARLYERHGADRIVKIFLRDVSQLGGGGNRIGVVPDARHAKQIEYVRATMEKMPADRWALFDDPEVLIDFFKSFGLGSVKAASSIVSH